MQEQGSFLSRTISANRSRITSIAVSSGLMMEFIDSSALATALPTMAQDFDVRPESLKLALTSYVLAIAMFVPASAWLADRLGAKRVYLSAICVFVIGSVACAFSTSLEMLVAFRFLQGMGGSFMLPVARTIIVRSAPREDLVSALAWFTIPALIGPLIGPPLAGFILGVASWHWIFLVCVPVSLLSTTAIAWLVQEPSVEAVARPFDWRGFALMALAMALLMGTIELAGFGASGAMVAASLAGAVLIGGMYVRHARGTEHPVLDLRLLRHASVRISMASSMCVRLGAAAFPLILPLYFQIGLGWTPLEVGTVMIATGLGVMLAKPVAPLAFRRFGFRTALIASNLLAAVSATLTALFTSTTSMAVLYAVLVTVGFTRSIQFTGNSSIAFSDLPDNEISGASTLSSVTQQLGVALGLSLGGLLIEASRNLTPGGELNAGSFDLPIIGASAAMALASLVYMRMPRNLAENIRGGAGKP